MKIDFTQFKIVGIDGKEAQSDTPIYQIIGNKVWEFASDLGLKSIAESIYKGEEVEVSTTQAEQIKTTCSDTRTGLLPFFGRELNAFIDKH